MQTSLLALWFFGYLGTKLQANTTVLGSAAAVVCISTGLLVAKLLLGKVNGFGQGDLRIVRAETMFFYTSLVMLFAAAVAT